MKITDKNSIEKAGEILNQKLNDLIKDSRTKSSALKKIIKGLEDSRNKPHSGKHDK